MIRGSCLCGQVKFEISGKPQSLSYCHCSRCRKSGGIYSAVLIGSASDLSIVQGENQIARYTPEPPFKYVRCSCKNCGSPLGEMTTDEGTYVIAASALDDDPGLRPMAHLNTASKPAWYDIDDDLKKFEGNYVSEE